MRVALLSIFALVGLMQAVPAYAQQGDLGARVRTLENQVYSQQTAINDLYNRLDRLDRRGPGPGPRPRPQPGPAVVNCLLVDTFYAKTFLGSANTNLDAEFKAREACGKVVSSSYCTGAIRCDSTADNPYSPGAVCVMTDSFYNKAFRGEGSTLIEAEALAKQSCQGSVSASYCGNVTARCELKQ